MTTKQISHLRTFASLLTGTALGAVLWTVPATAQEAGKPMAERKYIHAPWSPDQLEARRKALGLVGPGSAKPYPKPRFPGSLGAPKSIEALMPGARAAVRQTGGRAPLGLVKTGEVVLIPIPHDANPLAQEAVKQAFKERGVEARIIYAHELAGMTMEEAERANASQKIFDASDGQQEPARWFFGSIPDQEKAKAWLKERDPALYEVTFPSRPSGNDGPSGRAYEALIAKGIIKYLDDHPEVTRVFYRTGGRTRTRKSLQHHSGKFIGNYTYNSHFDLMSDVAAFPSDVWRLVETKTIEPLGYVDRLEASDPEGTVVAADVTPDVARVWAKGVYQQGHLYLFPNQASGRYPYSLVDYPSYVTEYIPPIRIPADAVIAGTNNHRATHSRMEIIVKEGKVASVTGGGFYGEVFRHILKYPGINDLTYPFLQSPGYWWLYEAGTGTNPKYFKHPDELLIGRNSSERNVGGTIHWSFGVRMQHGPEEVGKESPKVLAFARVHNLPTDHCCHSHALMMTYQVRIRDLDQWVTLIEHGRLTALDDLYVRALASRYGNPDEILKQAYVPPLPGINMPGDYNEYARDPGSYWVKWSKSVKDGTYAYFDK